MSLSRFTDRGALETREFVHSRRLTSVADDLNFIAHLFFRRPRQPPPDQVYWNESLEAFREVCQRYQQLYPTDYSFEDGFSEPYPSWMARVGEPVAALHRPDFETPLYSLLSGTETEDQLRNTLPPLVRDLVALGRPHGRLLITDIWVDTRSNKDNRPFLPDYPFFAKPGERFDDRKQLGLLIHQIVVHDGDRAEVDLKDPAWSEINLRKTNWKEICEVLMAEDSADALQRAQPKARGATRELLALIAKLPSATEASVEESGVRGGGVTSKPVPLPQPPPPKAPVDLGKWLRNAQSHYREVAGNQARIEAVASGLGAAVDAVGRSLAETKEAREAVEAPLAAARTLQQELHELRRRAGHCGETAVEATRRTAQSVTEALEFSRSGVPEGSETDVLEACSKNAEAARVEVEECLRSLDELQASGDTAARLVEAAAAATGEAERQLSSTLASVDAQSREVAGWIAEWRATLDQAGAANQSVASLNPKSPDVEAAADALVADLATLHERAGELATKVLEAQTAIEQSVRQLKSQVAGAKKAGREGGGAAESLGEILGDARSRLEQAETQAEVARKSASEATETLQRLRLGPVVSAQRAAAEAEELAGVVAGERASLENVLTRTLAAAERIRKSTEALPGTSARITQALQALDGGGRAVDGAVTESQRAVRGAEGLMRQGRQVAELTVAALPASPVAGLDVGKAKRGIDADLGKLQEAWERADRHSKEAQQLITEIRKTSENSGALRKEAETARKAWETATKIADSVGGQVLESRRVGDRVVTEVQSEVAKAKNAARQAEATDGAARMEASTLARRHLGSAKERAKALLEERAKAEELQRRSKAAEAEAGTRVSAGHELAANVDKLARSHSDLVARVQAAGRSAQEAEKQILTVFSALIASLSEIAGRIGEAAVRQWRASGTEVAKHVETIAQRRAALNACRQSAEAEQNKLNNAEAARAEGERVGQKHLETVRASRQAGAAAEKKADEVLARLGDGLRTYGKQISQTQQLRQRVTDGEEALRIAVAHLDGEARQADDGISSTVSALAELGEKTEHARSLATSIQEHASQGEAALSAFEARSGDAESRVRQADALEAAIQGLRALAKNPAAPPGSQVEALAALISQLGEAGRSEALTTDATPTLARLTDAQAQAEEWVRQLSQEVASLPTMVEACRAACGEAGRKVEPVEERSEAVARAHTDLEALERELNRLLDPIRKGRRRKLVTWLAATAAFIGAVVYLIGTHLVTAPGADLNVTLVELDSTNINLKVRSILKPQVEWSPTNIAGVAVTGPDSTTLAIRGLTNGGSKKFRWAVRTPFRQSIGQVNVEVKAGTKPEFRFQTSAPTELDENDVLNQPAPEAESGGGLGYRWFRVMNGNKREPFPISQFKRPIGEILGPEETVLQLICEATNRFGGTERPYSVTVSSHLKARDASANPETYQVNPGESFTLKAPPEWGVPSARFQWLDDQFRPMANQTNASLSQTLSNRANSGAKFLKVRHRGLSLTNAYQVEVAKLEVTLSGPDIVAPNQSISIQATVKPPTPPEQFPRTNLWRRNGQVISNRTLEINERAPATESIVEYQIEVSDLFRTVSSKLSVLVTDNRPAPRFAEVQESQRQPRPGEFHLGKSTYRILVDRSGIPNKARFVPQVDPRDTNEVEAVPTWLNAPDAPALKRANDGGWETGIPAADRTNRLQVVLKRGKQETTNVYEVVFGQPPKIVNLKDWKTELQEAVPWVFTPMVDGTKPVNLSFERGGKSVGNKLEFQKPSIDDLGVYQLTVANSFATNKLSVELTNFVVAPPSIVVRMTDSPAAPAMPAEFTAKEGAKIYASLANGSPADGILWSVGDNASFPSNQSIEFTLNSGGKPFVNVSAKRRIKGIDKTFESRPSGSVQIKIGQGPQSPTILLSKTEIGDGETIPLSLEGVGAGSVLNWNIDGNVLTNAKPTFVGENKTSEPRAVEIKVTVSNDYGVASNRAALKVLPPVPTFFPKTNLPPVLKLAQGTEVSVEFNAEYHTGIRWTRNGQDLPAAEQNQKHVRITSEGTYRGIATNRFHASKPVDFTVELSMPPIDIKIGGSSLLMVRTKAGGGLLWMSKTEVSQGFWKAVRGSLPSGLAKPSQSQDFKQDDLPVVFVRFDEVLAFVEDLNKKNNEFAFRLPTRSEWIEVAQQKYPRMQVPAKECLVPINTTSPRVVHDPSVAEPSDELHYLGGNVLEMTAAGPNLDAFFGINIRGGVIGGPKDFYPLRDNPSRESDSGFLQPPGEGVSYVGFRLVGGLKR
ncbi:MAG: hypothetical protein IT581_10845 [Verrucomicrobiales bacterium]|nr:hypothetical protein [Verrucomicrobiales bacterium]